MRVAVVGVVEIHAKHDGDIRVLGGGGDDHFLRAGLEVLRCGLPIGEETRGLNHDLGAQFLPGQLGRVSLTEDLYLLAVEADRVLRMLDLPWKRAER